MKVLKKKFYFNILENLKIRNINQLKCDVKNKLLFSVLMHLGGSIYLFIEKESNLF
jgi:hypothetical protein